MEPNAVPHFLASGRALDLFDLDIDIPRWG